MRFYKQPHAFYAGIDLHARSMFTHILDHAGASVFERDLPANSDAFLNAVAPWLADLCEDEATRGGRTWHREVSGARRFSRIPPEGKIGKQRRRRLGKADGLIP